MTYAFKPLIERLRDPALMKRWWDQYGLEAADEIESLTLERNHLSQVVDDTRAVASSVVRQLETERDRLRTALETARGILGSDSIEYDDVRNLEQTIDAALSGEHSPVESALSLLAERIERRHERP